MYINRHCAAQPAGAITATYVAGTVAAVGGVAIFSLHRSTVKRLFIIEGVGVVGEVGRVVAG